MDEEGRLSHSAAAPGAPAGVAEAAAAAAVATARLAEYERRLEAAYGEPHPVYAQLAPAARAALYAGVPLEKILGPPPEKSGGA